MQFDIFDFQNVTLHLWYYRLSLQYINLKDAESAYLIFQLNFYIEILLVLI